MGRITSRVITEFEGFKALAEIWSELLSKCDEQNSPFLTHERLFSWWQHFGKDKLLNILVVEKGNQVIAILPLMTVVYKRLFLKYRVLETIEAQNCNYIGIIPVENIKEVMPLIVAYLRNMLRSHLALKLRSVPEDSELLRYLSHQRDLHSKGLSLNTNIATLAPYVKLHESWQKFLGSISRKRRAILRQGLQRIGASHDLQFGTYTLETLDTGLEEFFALHQKRWHTAGIGSPFSSKKCRVFYREFSRRFLEKGWLHFSYLIADKKVISSIIGFVYNNKYWASKAARDTHFARYSVGHLHYMYLIKWAIERKLTEFDFLQGDESYKFYWTKKSRKYLQVTITRRGFFSWLYVKCLNTTFFLRRSGIKA